MKSTIMQHSISSRQIFCFLCFALCIQSKAVGQSVGIFVVETNVTPYTGCRDTFWFRCLEPIPAIETENGSVIQMYRYDISSPEHINKPPLKSIPCTIWLSTDKKTIYCTATDAFEKNTVSAGRSGPYYALRIFNRFTTLPPADSIAYEYLFMQHSGAYKYSACGKEEISGLIIKEKIGETWFYPISDIQSGDIEPPDSSLRVVDTDTPYQLVARTWVGDRKFLGWQVEAENVDQLHYSPTSNHCTFWYECGIRPNNTSPKADVRFTALYSQPIRWGKITITYDSTLLNSLWGNVYHHFSAIDGTPWEESWSMQNGKFEVRLLQQHGDSISVLVTAANVQNIPIQVESNLPRFRYTSDVNTTALRLVYSLEEGENDVHLHFTRSRTSTVQTNNTLRHGYTTLGCYPQPAKVMATIDFEAPESGLLDISVISLTGQILQKQKQVIHQGSNHININTTALATGIYMYHIEFAGSLITSGKLIVAE
jgi:hypothetical protein